MKCAIGQDSHRFQDSRELMYKKPLVLGGVCFENEPCLVANSDGDVILHALTNAISGLTARNILGSVADNMLKSGISDSKEYLKVALDDLKSKSMKLTHVSFTIECKRPKMSVKTDEMRISIGKLTGLAPESVGITATSGEGLTSFGLGSGIMVFCIVTAEDI